MGSGIKMSVLLFSFALISAISIDDLPEKNNIYIKPLVVINEKSVEYKLDDLKIVQPMFVVVPKDRNESFAGPPTHHHRKLLENIEFDAEEYDDNANLDEEESDDDNADLDKEESDNDNADLDKEESDNDNANLDKEESDNDNADLDEEESDDDNTDLDEEESNDDNTDLDEEESDDNKNTGSRRLLKKSRAPAPAPAPKRAPAPAPAPKRAPAPAPAPKRAPAPAPAPKRAPAPAPAPKRAPAPAPAPKRAPAPAPAPKRAPAPAPAPKRAPTPAPAPKKAPLKIVVKKSVIPIISSTVKKVLSTNNKKLDDWLNTDKGKEAVDFCKSLGILNNNRVYVGCLEDMMVVKDKKVAKESAISAEEVLSSDNKGTSKRFCQASGDPHVTNYDGSYFHIQEQGIYTVAKTNGFEVQEKMRKNGANSVGVPSCMTGAVVKYGSIVIEIDVYNYKKILVNGQSIDIPNDITMRFGGVQVKYGKQSIEWKGEKATATGMKITTKNGFMVMIEGSYCGVLEVNAPVPYYGKMSGICGNADGNKNGNDFSGIDGKVMDVNYGKNSWDMSGYGGPTAPLSKWQLSWKPLGSSCYFVSGCEPAPPSPAQVVIKKISSPVISKPKPVISKPKPVVSKTKPVVSKTKPVVSKTKPAVSKTKPVVSKTKPVVSKTKPVVSKTKPVVSKTKPVVSKTKPVVSKTKPVVSKTKPVVSKTKPVVSKTKPAVSVSSPSKSSHKKKYKKDKTSIKVKEIVKDIKKNVKLSTNKINSLKANVFKLINNEYKKLESELSDSKKVVLLTDGDVEKLKAKYENKIKEYRAMNQTIVKLEKTIKQHYQQMESDTKYLRLLEKIKPSFMGTLQSFGKIALDFKNIISNNIVEGGDKDFMLRVLYEMTEPAKNTTSILSSEFIKHYEKYKRRVGVDKDTYDKEYSELQTFRNKYKNERKIKNILMKDYKNSLTILNKLRKNYKFDEEDVKEFEKLSSFIKSIFDYKKC